MKKSTTAFEVYYNQFAPLYQAMVLYLVAFVVICFSLLFWRRQLSWAAIALILVGLGLHTFALVARIYISGRPPVTNLYSSAVFIGWGGGACSA